MPAWGRGYGLVHGGGATAWCTGEGLRLGAWGRGYGLVYGGGVMAWCTGEGDFESATNLQYTLDRTMIV